MSEIEFAGERFQVADKIGLMPLMRFAKVAQGGVDSDDMAGLAAMYDLLAQCFPDAEWARFQAAADRARADGEELMGVVGKVMAALADRPTSRSSDSSDGPTTTVLRSVDDDSSQVIQRLEAKGRPDLALMVTMAQDHRSVG